MSVKTKENEKIPTHYEWTLTHIIVGIPTRRLTVEEYTEYAEKIKLSEVATQAIIYKPVFEEEKV